MNAIDAQTGAAIEDKTAVVYGAQSNFFNGPPRNGKTLAQNNADYQKITDQIESEFQLANNDTSNSVRNSGNVIVDPNSGVTRTNSGPGDDFSVANQGEDIVFTNDTTKQLFGGSGNQRFVASPGSTLKFLYKGGSDTPEIDTIDPNGCDAAKSTLSYATSSGEKQLTGPGEDSKLTYPDNGLLWTATDGTEYKYEPLNGKSNLAGDAIGTLTISKGVLGTNGGKMIVNNFNLTTATQDSKGYLGIKIIGRAAIEPKTGPNPFISGDQIKDVSSNAGGPNQTFTIFTAVTDKTAQTINLVLSGADASLFKLSTGAELLSFSNGSISATIPAGSNQVTLSLVYTGDATKSQSVQLTSNIVGGEGQTTSPNSNVLSIAFNGTPAPELVMTPLQGNVIKLDGVHKSYTFYDVNNYPDNARDTNFSVVTDNESNRFRIRNGNASLTGGTSDDFFVTGNGKSTIAGGGGSGQDLFLLGNGDNKVFAGSVQTDLAAMLSLQKTAVATHVKGDYIAVGDGNNTIVGGNGDDDISVGTGNNVIVCGPGSVTVSGGTETTTLAANWTSTMVGHNIVNTNVSGQVSPPFNAPDGYQGSTLVEDTGSGQIIVPVGLGNDTIFGGTGNSYYLLSNGNNYLDAGGGNDQIQAGIGNNTIYGGKGNDTIFGGGGNNYIDCETGTDFVVLQGGNSTVLGGTGDDTIYSGDSNAAWATSQTKNNNYIFAGSGNTQIYGAGGNDTLIGGSGNDTLYAGAGKEVLLGGSGKTVMVAGAGDDYIRSGSGDSTIYGGAGKDTLVAGSGKTLINGGSGDATIYGGSGKDTIYGGAGKNIIYAGNGGNAAQPTIITAGVGDTTVYGGEGISKISAGAGSDVIYSGDGGTEDNPTEVFGGSGNVTIYGGAGVAKLTAGSGTSTLVAGSGTGIFFGGQSPTTYQIAGDSGNTVINNSGAGDQLKFGAGVTIANIEVSTTQYGNGRDVIFSLPDGGIVTISLCALSQVTFGDGSVVSIDQLLMPTISVGNTTYSSVDQTLPASSGNGGQALVLTGYSDLVATGNNVSNTIVGNLGNDVLIAGTANDTLVGGGDSDVYKVTAGKNTVTTINRSTGADNLNFSTGITLSSLSVSAATSANGTLITTVKNNGGGSVVINANADGSMVNTLSFSDNSLVSLGAMVAALTDGPTAASSSTDVTLAPIVRNMTLTGTGNVTAIGNQFDNIITANSGNDTLIAGGGNDTLVAGIGNATLVGGIGAEQYTIRAGTGTTTIQKSAVQDTLTYGTGITAASLTATLVTDSGGISDVTIVNAQGGSVVIKNWSEDTVNNLVFADGSKSTLGQLLGLSGNDPTTMTSSVSVPVLPPAIKTLTLTGSDNLTATGNSLPNLITANSGNDTITAGSGTSTLVGGSGNSVLIGGTGNDTLIAGTGLTTMIGGATGTSDVFVVHNTGDVVQAGSNAANDIEQTTVSMTAAGGIQKLTGIGTDNIVLTANDLSDIITANTGNDTLIGASGNSTLIGGAGNDSLVAGSGNTVIHAGGGNNTLVGGHGNNLYYGETGNDTIISGTANDTLIAGSGTEVLQIIADRTHVTATATAAGDGTANVLLNIPIVNSSVQIQGVSATRSPTILMGDKSTMTISQLLALNPANAISSATGMVMPLSAVKLTLTGNADLSATGNFFDDVITANSGNDTLIAGTGNDTLIAGTGNATLVGGSGKEQYVVQAGNGTTTIQQSALRDGLTYGTGVTAASLTATLAAGISGGNDVTIKNKLGGSVVISNWSASSLNNFVFADGSKVSVAQLLSQSPTGPTAMTSSTSVPVLPAGILNLTLIGSGNLTATGNDLPNLITANNGNDTLTAGSGPSTLVGGSGNSVLVGGTGNDTLIAGGGATTLVGGAAGTSDTFVINKAGDVIQAGVNAANDIEQTSVSITAATGLLQLTGTGNANIVLTANNLNDLITANAGNDTLVAGVGNSTLVGGTGADTFQINSGTGATTISKATSSDTLVFGTGISLGNLSASTTRQGDGSYTMTVTNNLGGSVVIPKWVSSDLNQIKLADGSSYSLGRLLAQSSTGATAATSAYNTRMGTGIQHLTLTGTNSVTVYGNELDDVIVANDGNDTIYASDFYRGSGIGGSDTLIGGIGNSELDAGFGDTTLIAGSGLVTMVGGGDNSHDTFIVNNSSDVLLGGPGNASFTVQTSVDFTLSSNISGHKTSLVGTGSNNLTLKGNSTAATIVANSGNDVLIAGSANDTLVAGSGSDTLTGGTGSVTYIVNTGNVSITNSNSNDTLQFGAGISAGNIVFTNALVGNLPTMTLKVSGGPTVTMQGGLSKVKFADGSYSAYVSDGLGNSTVSNYMVINKPTTTYVFDLRLNTLNLTTNTTEFSEDAVGSLMTIKSLLTGDISNIFDAAISPSGQYLYVASNSLEMYKGNVWQYAIAPDGSLTSIGATAFGGSTSNPDQYPVRIILDPTGKFAYTLNQNNLPRYIAQFSVGADGKLTPLSTARVAASVTDLIIDPTGKYAYGMTNLGTGVPALYQFTIGADGSLNPMATPIASGIAGVGFFADFKATIDPSGKYLIFGASEFSIGSDGQLTAMAAPFNDNNATNHVVFDNSGKYVYRTTSFGTGISAYAFNANGSVTPLSVPIVSSGVAFDNITIDPTGKYLYASSNSGATILEYAIGTDGVLSPLANSSISANLPTGFHPSALILATTKNTSGIISTALSSDNWTKADGSYGSNTYTQDGKSSGAAHYANGTISTYNSDGITATTTGTYVATGTVVNIVGTGNADMTLTGNSRSNVITANTGNDTLIASGANDTLVGGTGKDTLTGGTASTTYLYNKGNGLTTINQTTSTDILKFGTGITAADIHASSSGTGSSTVVTLTVAGGGNIVVNGNTLTNVSYADGSTSTISALLGAASTMYSATSAVLTPGYSSLVLTGTASISGTGNSTAHTITANSGNDTLIAGTGLATLIGGVGNDTFILNKATDVIVEGSNNGIDTVQVAFSYDLPEGASNITATGSANVIMNGNSSANVMTANSGNDTLIAGAGLVTMVGGAGNNVFEINNASDVIIQSANTSQNLLKTSTTYVLPANVQNLSGTYSGNITLTGNTLANVITANTGNDSLVAVGANDTLIGGIGKDTLKGGSGNTTYVYNKGNGLTTISQTASTDILKFGTGLTAADIHATSSGSGSSTVVTLTVTGGGNVVVNGNTLSQISFTDGGTTTIGNLLNAASTLYSATSTVMPANITSLVLTGTASITGTGNSTAHTITANSGNDTLIAGTGLATLIGGTGNDTFVVNNTGDVIMQGADTNPNLVQTSVSYTLPANVQKITGTGTGNLVLTGNSTAHTITANTGNDTLVAGAGLATLIGGTGTDTFVVNNSADVITQTANTNKNLVQTSVNYVLPANVQNITGTGSASISLTGNTLANVITGNSGNDTLIAGTGLATLVGGTGNNVFVINNASDVITQVANTNTNLVQTSVSYVLPANVQNITGTGSANISLTGNSLANVITANSGNDTLIAGAGNDTLISGTGKSTLTGGAGNTTYVFNKGNGVTTITQGASGDTLKFGTGLTAADIHATSTGSGSSTVVTLTVTGGGSVVVNGNTLSKVSFTDGGTSTISSLLSAATTMYSATSAVLSAGMTSLVLTGTADITGTGNSSAHTITANSGNDTLIAGSGLATLVGGTGNDTFVLNNAADVVVEGSTNGIDTVQVPFSFTTPTGVRNITGTGTANITLTGNSLANVITANTGNDTLVAGSGLATLVGGTGTSTFVVNNSADVITQAANSNHNLVQTSVNFVLPANVQNITGTGSGNISLTGNSLANVITANSGNDTLIAGSGLATLVGGTGTSTFVINNVGDVITQAANTNKNLIQTSVSYVLPANVQNMTGTGNANLTLTGNTLANVITGNAGNDTLIAGTGLATLVGGTGSNVFVINNASDVITQAANANTNLVQTSVSYTLPANVQNITGTGSASITLTGNSLSNVITGNAGTSKLVAGSGDTTLIAGSGITTMTGGAGNDTFVVNNIADVVVAQTGGVNLIKSSVSYTMPTNVQSMILTGTGALTATGNSGDNLIVSNGGASTLEGGAGTDVLEGGTGASTLKDSGGASAMLGGSGNTTMIAGSGAQFIAGGAGTNTITLGAGAAVVAFTTGDGKATITAGTGVANTLSLGGGISYSDLTFSKSGNNLIMNTGGANAITFQNWYSGTANQNFVNLQVIEQAASTYSASSTNILYNKEIEEFDFKKLVGLFNTALAATPTLTNWNLMNSLLSAHLSDSNTAALGGDLAYYDGLRGSLTGLNMATAVTTLQNASFGKTAQTVDAWAGVSASNNRIQ
ncbi:hypothetical protein [Undibacterium sp. TJN19]|uniref:hypothetical protein n=1 Tax=Undibacterium sp. TJN19 TaxID=3413055 RepID=UPI003BEF80F1